MCVQGHALLWPGKGAKKQGPAITKREQPKQAQAPAARKQAAQPKQPPKPSLEKALTEPEKFKMIKGEFIRRLDGPYGKLYRALNLDPATLQKLRGLLADKELALMEGYSLAKDAKMPLKGKSLSALRDDADGAIRELLGDDAFATYKNYENTLPARNHATALENFLSNRAEPLTGEQYNALVSALSNVKDSDIKPGSGAWMGNYIPDLTEESLSILHGILTPSQFAIYEAAYENMMLEEKLKAKYTQDNSAPKKNTKRNKGKK